MGKICRTCKEDKPEDEFYTYSSGRLYPDCKTCTSTIRKNHLRNSRSYYLGIRYRNMENRAKGFYGMSSGATGLPLLTREEFLNWYKETEDIFEALWKTYVESDFDLTNAPSVDRIDPKKGYEIGNLQWLSQSDNCSKGDKSPFDYASYTASN